MPKNKKIESVLHDWVHTLNFQMQALLMTAIRGADAIPKHDTSKCIIRYFRGTVLKPAGDWKGKNDNDFMWGEYMLFNHFADKFWYDHDLLPHHFLMHLIHCAEVVGYKHPSIVIRAHWNAFYLNACRSFHMKPESEKEMDKRLNDFGCGIHNKNDRQ